MVAIVAGNGLGLLNTSLNTIGGAGSVRRRCRSEAWMETMAKASEGEAATAGRGGPAEDGAGARREIDSQTLFGDARVVSIRHGGDLYTLRVTRADKLILTK